MLWTCDNIFINHTVLCKLCEQWTKGHSSSCFCWLLTAREQFNAILVWAISIDIFLHHLQSQQSWEMITTVHMPHNLFWMQCTYISMMWFQSICFVCIGMLLCTSNILYWVTIATIFCIVAFVISYNIFVAQFKLKFS